MNWVIESLNHCVIERRKKQSLNDPMTHHSIKLVSLFFGDKFFVIGGGKHPVKFRWILHFYADHPRTVSVGVDLFRGSGQGFVDGSNFAGKRSKDLRDPLHRFHRAKALALRYLGSHFM